MISRTGSGVLCFFGGKVINMDAGASVRSNVIINKDCLAALKDMPDKSVDCCITSPPYYGLRDYGTEGQIGREAAPEQYVERLMEVFAQLYRVLSDSGTFWLNISDSYCGTGSKGACLAPKNPKGRNGQKVSLTQNVKGCKNKDMMLYHFSCHLIRKDLMYNQREIRREDDA